MGPFVRARGAPGVPGSCLKPGGKTPRPLPQPHRPAPLPAVPLRFATAGQLQATSQGCPHGLWHVPSTLYPPVPCQGGCWGPAGCLCEPGLPQGFSITGAAPGPSSLLLLSIRGEVTGRAERGLRLASLRGFLSCRSPTDIVPGVSPAARQRCQGRQAGIGLVQPGDVTGS